jgi:nucleotide-binding universal stress UspA family protein
LAIARSRRVSLSTKARVAGINRIEHDEVAQRLEELAPSGMDWAGFFATIPEIRRILVCDDGSAHAQLAIRWAGSLASWFKSEVTVVTVVPTPSLFARLRYEVAPLRRHEVFEGLQRGAEDVLARARRAAPLKGLVVTTVLEQGSVVPRILAVCKDIKPDLLIVGARGHGNPDPMLVASVADSVKHQAPCSVLVVRNEPPPSRIVVATDGSKAAAHAVRLALRLGVRFGCPATVVHAHDVPPEGMTPAASRNDPVRGLIKELYPIEVLQGSLRFTLKLGPPVKAILETATREKAGLLVIGSRGLGGKASRILGSTSDNLSRYAKQSVLIVK